MDDVYCFGGNPLDRASERRDDDDWIAKLLGDPDTRFLALHDLKPFLRGTTVPALDWQPAAQWRAHIDNGAPLIFLGLGDRRAHFAIDAAGADVVPDVDTGSIDVLALAPTLAPGETAILAEARSVLDWHARHRFCAQCGAPTRMASAGWERRCPEWRASHFPRTDPVVIMLATRGDQALPAATAAAPGRGSHVWPASSSRVKPRKRPCAGRYGKKRASAAGGCVTWPRSRGRFRRA